MGRQKNSKDRFAQEDDGQVAAPDGMEVPNTPTNTQENTDKVATCCGRHDLHWYVETGPCYRGPGGEEI